ncbi:MAG: insulinase family protein [Bdellovibrionales bacterium]|nr:insulinase family protein [Bdellovibrionales bacterium]
MKSCFKKNTYNKKKIFILFAALVSVSYFANLYYKTTTKKTYTKNQHLNTNNKNRNLSSLGAVLNLKVEKFVLNNGLTVLLCEDHSTPTLLTYVQWVKTGSSDEPSGQTGYAHFFEHLLFKGTENISSEEFEITTSVLGGSNNAFTNYDSTVYHMNLSNVQLEWAIKSESERMKKLILFDPSKKSEAEALINSERGAVTDEKIRGESSVSSLMFKSLLQNLYKGSGYSHSIIGSMEDLNKSTLQDFHDFYKKYYSPNNTVIAIGGDFDPSQAKKWIYKYYDSIESSKINRLKFTKPDFVKAKDIDFKDIQKEKQLKNNKYKFKKVLQSQFIFAYPGVFITHKDKYAIDILMHILSGSTSSRLDKIIYVQKNLVSDIYAGNYPLNRVGAIYFGANILPKSSVKEVLDIIQQEIKNLQKNGVSKEELQIAINQLQFLEVDEIKTVYKKTMNLISAEVLEGDYNNFFTKLEKYNLVTASDVQRVAKKYLRLESRILVKAIAK